MARTKTLAQVKKDLAKAIKEKKAQIKEHIEMKKITIEMERLNSPSFLARTISKENNLKLDAILESIEENLVSGKIIPVFGFGAQVDKILTIARNTIFAPIKTGERDLVLECSGIDFELLEETHLNMGSTTYFNNDKELVEEILPDIEALKANIEDIAQELGLIDVKMNRISKKNFDGIHARANLKAQHIMEATIKHQDNVDKDVKYDT